MIVEWDSTHAIHFGPDLGTDNSTWLLKILISNNRTPGMGPHARFRASLI